MRSLMMILAAGLALAPASAENAAPYLAARKLVRLPDGRRMNLYCTGHGGPTVVLEGGWTTETSYWRKVQPLLAKRAQVCSYDRAGYGFSDPGPMPRTAAAIEHDFAQMLDAAPIRGRIILVAHSLGTFPARLYAETHRNKIAALILLDPPTEDDPGLYAAIDPAADPKLFVEAALACSAAVIAHPTDTPKPDLCLGSPSPMMPERFNRMRARMQMTAGYQQTAASELGEMYGASADQVRAARRPLGAMPLIVLTAGEGSTDPSFSASTNTALREVQWTAQGKIAALSTRPVHRLLAGASHYIPMERPADVVSAVDTARQMLAPAHDK